MAYFLSQSVRNLLANAIGLKFSSSFCHRVAPSPVLQASVVMKFSFFGSKCAKHGVSVISFFNCSKSSFISFVHSHFVSFFSNLLILSVFLDRLFKNFDKCCIEPRNDFNSLVFVGASNFVIASVLSLFGFTPFWFISYPNQVSSFLNNSVFFSRSLGNRFLVVSTIFRVTLLRVLLLFRW